jgi:hypothetical protein
MRALQELDDSSFAQPTKVGAWRGKKATEWRLTFRLCNKTDELPINNWPQRKPYREFQTDNTKVSNQKHRDVLRFKPETHRAKNPMNGSGLSFTHETHVHISREDAVRQRTARARRRAGLDPPPAQVAAPAPRRNGRGETD